LEEHFLPPDSLLLHSFFTSLTTLARHLEERRDIAFNVFKVAGHLSSDNYDDFNDHSTVLSGFCFLKDAFTGVERSEDSSAPSLQF
jgi:hypothetical protein